MATIAFGKKKYRIDRHGFLLDPDEWDDRGDPGLENISLNVILRTIERNADSYRIATSVDLVGLAVQLYESAGDPGNPLNGRIAAEESLVVGGMSQGTGYAEFNSQNP